MDKALLVSKAPLAATMALAVGMAASVGMQGYGIWKKGHDDSANVVPQSIQMLPNQNKRPTQDMVNANIFGLAQDNKPAEVQTENLPTTNLQLILRGVSSSKDESLASALVEESNKETQVYVIGDKLPGNATLRGVYSNRIVIERQGRLENLYFPEGSSGGSANFTAYDTPDSTSDYQEPPQEYVPDQPDYQPEVYDSGADTSSYVEPSQENVVQEEAPASQNSIQPVQQEEDIPQAQPNPNQPAYVLDSLSEERKQEIRERLQRLREQIINQ